MHAMHVRAWSQGDYGGTTYAVCTTSDEIFYGTYGASNTYRVGTLIQALT